MAIKPNPAEKLSQTERLLRQERTQLRHTNQLLEERVKARTQELHFTNQQLEQEIVERGKTEQKLQHRIVFDKILTKISSNFINLTIDEIDSSINGALQEVGNFHGFDRVYIYLLEENGRSLTLTHGWHKEDHPTSFKDFSNLPANLFENWLPQLLAQKTLFFQNIAEANEEIGNELTLLALQNIRSALIVPLVFGNKTIGFLGLDSCEPTSPWQGEGSESFKTVGAIIVNALMRRRAEEALVEERNFAKQIMDTMGQGVATISVEGTFEYINQAYAHMLGYEPEELVGKSVLTFTYHEDHPQLLQAQMQNLQRQPCSYEARLCRADGSWLYALVNSVPNYNRQDHVIGIITTITDLTERRKAQTVAEANADELKLIYQAAVQLFQPGSLKELAGRIATVATHQLGFDACSVLLLEEPIKLSLGRVELPAAIQDNYLTWLVKDAHCHNPAQDKLYLSEGGLITTAVRQGEIIYAPDVTQNPHYVPGNTATLSEMVIPLSAYDHIIGVIDLQSPHKNGFDENARRRITIFAKNAGFALETVRLYEQLCDHASQLELQINERNKIEQALRTSEQRYKQLVENATDMIFRTDADGYLTYANPVTIRTLGYAQEQELLGHHYTDFIHPDCKFELIKAYNQQRAEQIPNTYFEFIALDKNQKEIWLGQNVQLITEYGRVIGYQALARDITKRREAEEELNIRSNELSATNAKLARALRTKDEFLANMSHELRTPLNAILGKAEILQEGIHGPLSEKQIASLQMITESGNHLLELINDVLDMAKIESGKATLDIQKISLANICESSLQFVRQMAHKKQIKLQANIAHSLKTCQADERRLKQILINLLSNAVKFTPPEGEVGLNIINEPERDAVHFQVWDTGVGISPEDMKRLFKPFVQVDSSLARPHEGTGLGLSLVYRLAEMHGGSVSLESEVGVGSCFTVTLPQNPHLKTNSLKMQARTDRQLYTANHTDHQRFAPGEEPLILLVEDNQENIERMTEYLPIWGYELSVAHSGSEALLRAHEEHPDLILMDVQTPETDGLTVVRQLRQNKLFQKTPIIALTALAMNGDRERCLEAGANAYLSKPVQLRRLAMIINQLLAGENTDLKEAIDE